MTDDAYLIHLALVGPTRSETVMGWFPTPAAYGAWIARVEPTHLTLVWHDYYYYLKVRE